MIRIQFSLMKLAFTHLIVAFAMLTLLPTAHAETTLYERLGGAIGVQAISADLIEMSSTDPKTKRSFEKVNKPRLIKLLAQHTCVISGGGCVYEGDTMKQSHAGLGITEAEFAGMVENLRIILDRRGVSESAKNELLKLLAPTKRDVVEVAKIPTTDAQTLK